MRSPARILIVDDERDFLEVLVTKFQAAGFEVFGASDGEEAMAKSKELLPDLIVMDVKMPKLNGIEAMIRMREDPVTKNIRVVLLTAFGDPQPEIYGTDKRFAKELGAFEYILKSQDLEEIVEKIKRFLTQ